MGDDAMMTRAARGDDGGMIAIDGLSTTSEDEETIGNGLTVARFVVVGR